MQGSYGTSIPHTGLAAKRSAVDQYDVMAALAMRGVTCLREITFRPNRSRVISLSPDRRRLSLSRALKTLDDRILDAIADFINAPSGSERFSEATETLRNWHDWSRTRRRNRTPSCGTRQQDRYLRSVYRRLNASHFANALPVRVHIRLCSVMTSMYGFVAYATSARGRRCVTELAINIDLLMAGNEKALIDTMLHEMAHMEAWLAHGHRAHGAIWKAIARRVGCEPRACTSGEFKRRRRDSVTRVPRLRLPKYPTPGERSAGAVTRKAARRTRAS
jgi:hypothetical protein